VLCVCLCAVCVWVRASVRACASVFAFAVRMCVSCEFRCVGVVCGLCVCGVCA